MVVREEQLGSLWLDKCFKKNTLKNTNCKVSKSLAQCHFILFVVAGFHNAEVSEMWHGLSNSLCSFEYDFDIELELL